MTWLLIQGAVVFASYRPSALAAFAIAVTIISLASAAHATGFLSAKKTGRFVSLANAKVELIKKSVAQQAEGIAPVALEVPEEAREEARLNLLRTVLDMPVVDCATDPMTNDSVRSALDLLLSLNDRHANVDLA